MIKYWIAFISCFIISSVRANILPESPDSLKIVSEEIGKLHIEPHYIPYLERTIRELESETPFNDSLLAFATYDLAFIYYQTNRYGDFSNVINRGIEHLSKYSPDFVPCELYTLLGMFQMNLGNWNAAKDYYSIALNEYVSSNQHIEPQAVHYSYLARCYSQLGDQDSAVAMANRAIDILNGQDSSTLLLVTRAVGYQVIGEILYQYGAVEDGINYLIKAFYLCKEKDETKGIFNNVVADLANCCINAGMLQEAVSYLSMIHTELMNDNQLIVHHQPCYQTLYGLGDEDNSVYYWELANELIKNRIKKLAMLYSGITLDNMIEENLVQLKVNMGMLNKYSQNPRVRQGCYDNILFIKNISSISHNYILKAASQDSIVGRGYIEAREARLQLLLSEGTDSMRSRLEQLESAFLQSLGNLKANIEVPTCKDIQNVLKQGECAIEFVSVSSFDQEEILNDSIGLRISALLLKPDSSIPEYIEVGSFDAQRYMLLDAFREFEIGVNGLYQKEGRIIYYTPFSGKKSRII